ncbi:MAG: hypothetical protein ACYTEQ_20860 [Planctomycetota bacterium]|jgi:hypothetical protein
MDWVTHNWDNILAAVIAIGVAGPVGFFSGILMLKGEIASVRERMARLEGSIARSPMSNIELMVQPSQKRQMMERASESPSEQAYDPSNKLQLIKQELKWAMQHTNRALAEVKALASGKQALRQNRNLHPKLRLQNPKQTKMALNSYAEGQHPYARSSCPGPDPAQRRQKKQSVRQLRSLGTSRKNSHAASRNGKKPH